MFASPLTRLVSLLQHVRDPHPCPTLCSAGKVHVVTEDDVKAGTYRMEQVVLPLPGKDVLYPKHSTGDVYKQIADELGVRIDPDKPHHTLTTFQIGSFHGGYRHVIHRQVLRETNHRCCAVVMANMVTG